MNRTIYTVDLDDMLHDTVLDVKAHSSDCGPFYLRWSFYSAGRLKAVHKVSAAVTAGPRGRYTVGGKIALGG